VYIPLYECLSMNPNAQHISTQGHNGTVRAIAVSHDGAYAASASGDHTVILCSNLVIKKYRSQVVWMSSVWFICVRIRDGVTWLTLMFMKLNRCYIAANFPQTSRLLVAHSLLDQHTNTHVHTRTRTHAQTHTHTHTHTHTRTHTHAYMHTHRFEYGSCAHSNVLLCVLQKPKSFWR